MGSLGGLDVAFGAQLHICRTNIMVLDTNPASFTTTNAATCHSIASQKWASSLRPDFTVCCETDLTTGYLTEPTDSAEGGVLKSPLIVPVAGSQRDSTAANNRGLGIEAVLSIGAMQVATGNTGTVDDLFTDATGSTSGEEVGTGETTHVHDIATAVMKASFDAGSPASTFSIGPLLTDSAFGGGTAITTSDVSALTDTSTAAALATAVGDACWIVSVTTLASVL
jgi:hypothetical protein